MVIELQDWMLDVYCKILIWQIGQYVYLEIVGMLLEGNWIICVLMLCCKVILLVKVQDEVGYGLYFYSVVEIFGCVWEDLYQKMFDGQMKYFFIFNYLIFSWVDIGVIGWLVDGVVIVNQVVLCWIFYGFYVWVMVKICKEESFYQCQGFEVCMVLVQGNEVQWQMLQDVINCFWWLVLMMFGFNDDNLLNSVCSMVWKIKLYFNDELCQCFVDNIVLQVEIFGMIVLDLDLQFDEVSGYYCFGEIDWQEFNEVISGCGICNYEWLVVKCKVWEEGEWVCEVVLVYV